MDVLVVIVCIAALAACFYVKSPANTPTFRKQIWMMIAFFGGSLVLALTQIIWS